MKKPLLSETLTRRLTDGSLVFPNFALLAAVFQIFVVTRLRLLYYALGALFAVEVVLLAIAFLKAKRRDQVFLVVLVVTAVLFRLPLLSNPDGLILTSDNALEALQAVEIGESHQAPFYLLGAIRHNGTFPYLIYAFLFDVFGPSYLAFVLAHLMVFVLALYLLARILERHFDPTAVRALVLVQFVFLEVLFDLSLFLRGGPYLELVFFVLAGIWLFEQAGGSRAALGLAGFYLAFAFYVNLFALLLVVPFLLARVWLAGRWKDGLKILPPLAAGGLAALWHVGYYQLFLPKPPLYGNWFPAASLDAAEISLGSLPALILRLLRQVGLAFRNLFDFEFRYSLEFFAREIKGPSRSLLIALSQAAVWLSAAVLAAGLVLAVRRLIVRRKSLGTREWPFLFVLLLVPAFLAKHAVFLKIPFLEPRHNLDLIFIVLFSYAFVLSGIVRTFKLSWKTLVPVGLALAALSAPSYGSYLRMVRIKQADYPMILDAVRARGIRTVATDFMLAYPLWWVSGRTLEIADSLGPTKMYHFFPDRRARVDAVPLDKKAYLFFQRRYYRGSRHRNVTIILRENLLKELADKGVPYEVIDLKRYEIIAPFAAEERPGSVNGQPSGPAGHR